VNEDVFAIPGAVVVAMTGDGVNDALPSARPTSALPWVSPGRR
jgi:hypothetical protein